MAYFAYESVTLAGGTAGATTNYTTSVWNGYVHAFSVKLGTIATSETLTITGAETGNPIALIPASTATANVWSLPRTAIETVAGAAIAYTTGGANYAYDRVPIVNERMKIVVSQCTATAAGTILVYVGG